VFLCEFLDLYLLVVGVQVGGGAAARQQGDEVALEGAAHREVDERILRAVRVAEQQRQRRQPRYPAAAHAAAPAAPAPAGHGAGRRERQVEVDGVVRQPEAGEQQGDEQQHDGGAPAARQRALVAAAAAAAAAAATYLRTPVSCGVLKDIRPCGRLS